MDISQVKNAIQKDFKIDESMIDNSKRYIPYHPASIFLLFILSRML